MSISDAKYALKAVKGVNKAIEGILPASPPAVTPPALDSINALFDRLVVETDLVACTRQLFRDGHYSRAVEEAFKCLNNYIKQRIGSTIDGNSLMRNTFSPNSPLLKLNRMKTQSHRDEQQGYMDIYAGCMTGIRNPRAHEHTHQDDPSTALELIVFANHLMRKARLARRHSGKPSR